MLHTEDLVPMIRAVVMCQHAVLQVLFVCWRRQSIYYLAFTKQLQRCKDWKQPKVI